MHAFGQTPDVVMGLDDVRFPGLGAGGLDDVRIDRALGEPLHAGQLAGLLVEDLDEHSADDFPFFLRIGLAGQRGEKPPLGVDADDLHAHVLGEGCHDLIALPETKQSMVDEHTDELRTDRAVQERREHRGVDAPRQTEQHPVHTDLRANFIDGIFNDVARLPVALAPGNLPDETPQNLAALSRVRHLRMKLNRIPSPRLVSHRG